MLHFLKNLLFISRKKLKNRTSSSAPEQPLNTVDIYEDWKTFVSKQYALLSLTRVEKLVNYMRNQLALGIETPWNELSILDLHGWHVTLNTQMLISPVIGVLAEYGLLKELHLTRSTCEGPYFRLLFQALAQPNSKLSVISVHEHTMKDKDARAFITLLQGSTQLKQLAVSRDDNYGAFFIYEFIEWLNPETLECLDLSGDFRRNDSYTLPNPLAFANKDVKKVDLNVFPGLKRLNLSNSRIFEFPDMFLPSLAINSSITHLDLSGNVNINQVKPLISCIFVSNHSSNISHLRLASTGLDDETLDIITNSLQKPTSSLEVLDLSDNIIVQTGIEQLTNMFMHQRMLMDEKSTGSCSTFTPLRGLRLTIAEGLDAEGIKSFLRSILVHNSLEFLYLEFRTNINSFDEQFFEVFKKHQKLLHFWLIQPTGSRFMDAISLSGILRRFNFQVQNIRFLTVNGQTTHVEESIFRQVLERNVLIAKTRALSAIHCLYTARALFSKHSKSTATLLPTEIKLQILRWVHWDYRLTDQELQNLVNWVVNSHPKDGERSAFLKATIGWIDPLEEKDDICWLEKNKSWKVGSF